jgi:predicted ATPase/class 3 adenylate cyclase
VGDIPSGTVTLLFTDIEGSTRLWEEHPVEMRVALARHDELVRSAVEGARGWVFKTVGDAFCVAFGSAGAAVAGAVAAQRALSDEAWPEPVRIRARMALHSGECIERDDDYFGPTVNRAARIEAIAHGGQLLMSASTASLLPPNAMPDRVIVRDLGEHRLKDLAAPERVFQIDVDGLQSEFPPLRSLANPALRHNLPRYRSSFVGREADVAAILGLVGEGRLVTLTGPGGAGKTRLAVHAAVEMLDGSGDGVWLIELAPCSDAASVAATVAEALGIRLDSQTIVDALATRRMLLVLDNCEHVLGAVADIADAVLAECPSVALLATSREPLGVSGERLYRVSPLAVPDAHADIDALATTDSVQLFVQRAMDHQTDFRMTEANAPAIGAICRRLDGIPLAIELAAARVRSLSVLDISQRLDDRFRLLTTGNRAADARQQTLRTSIDWSYDLLDRFDQALLAQLSVFVGGWTIEASEQICRVGDAAGDTALGVLSLVDKSLVEYAEALDGTTRYRMLDTIRQYARERLQAEADEQIERLRRRHLEYFLALAEVAAPHLKTAEQRQWLDLLMRDNDNLRAALSAAIEIDDPSRAADLVVALQDYWKRRGHAAEVVDTVRRVADGATHSVETRIDLIEVLAGLHHHLGESSVAHDLLVDARGLAEDLADATRLAWILSQLASATESQGHIEEAASLAKRARAIADPTADDHLIAYCEQVLGNIASDQDDIAGARRHHREAIRRYTRCGDLRQAGGSLINLALSEIQDGALRQALVYLDEADTTLARDDDPMLIAYATHARGLALAALGKPTTALAHFRHALTAGEQLGNKDIVTSGIVGCANTLAPTAPETAATLCGFFDAEIHRMRVELDPVTAQLRAETEQLAADAIGAGTFTSLHERGGLLAAPDAVALALRPSSAIGRA